MTVAPEHGRAPWGWLGLVVDAALGAVVLAIAAVLLAGAWLREGRYHGVD